MELPEEVLQGIFYLLSTGDLLTVSCVNKAFQRIAMGPRLHRSVNFKGCWNIPSKNISKHMKQFKDSLECLDLEDCYWIKTADLRRSLLACKNLKRLNVFGCNITTNTLIQVLKNNDNLTELKFTDVLTHGAHTISAVLENPGKIKSLYLRINSYIGWPDALCKFADQHLNEFCLWQCPRKDLDKTYCLQKLYFEKTPALPGQQPHVRSFAHNFVMGFANFAMPLHDMHSDNSNEEYLVNYGASEVTDDIVSVVNRNSLRYLSITGHAWLKSHTLETIATGCSRLGTLNLRGSWKCLSPVDGMEILLGECQNLRHLNLASIHCHEEDGVKDLLLALSDLKMLSSLALTTCAVLSEENPTRDPDSIGPDCSDSSKEKGMISCEEGSQHRNIPEPSTASGFSQDEPQVRTEATEELFQLLTKSCQNLKEFELISGEFYPKFGNGMVSMIRKGCPVLSAAPLAYIANWKALKKLTLAGLNVRGSAQFLTTVMQGCPDLEHLSLAHLSLLRHSGGVASLNKALRYSQSLKEFRLEQPHFNISKQFLSSLGNAIKLERLCIIAKDGTFAEAEGVLLFEQCHRLICFQAMCDVTKTTVNSFKKAVSGRFEAARPALSIWLEPYHRNAHAKDFPDFVPWVHLQDMMLFRSNVATSYH